jgi:uncharacterized lipoprotein
VGNIAEDLNNASIQHRAEASETELGVEFPVYEDWWPETKKLWQERNYKLIKKMA